jgi:DNA-directed RNA polymerase specialized sigma24 family protein
MITCRSIPAKKWDQARQALVFYFSRGQLRANAEDLAHDTLAALWNRDDFEFEGEDDFLRICYAFAHYVAKAGYRKELKFAYQELTDELTAQPGPSASRLSSQELSVFLREVREVGTSELRQRDWEIIHGCCFGQTCDNGRYGRG